MGQKTELTPEEWEMLDELSPEDELFGENSLNSSIFVKVDETYDSLELAHDPSEIFEDPAELLENLSHEDLSAGEFSLDTEIQLENNSEHTAGKPQQRKIVISRKGSGRPISAQEEDVFRKQIQDLFDLLELEKEDLKEGVRVYQTDSSPSMPWRFH